MLRITPDELVVDKFSAALGGGQIEGQTTIDLQQTPYRGRFDLSVDGVSADAVRTLTRIPNDFSGNAIGQLHGQLELTVGAADISLDGKGRIEDARVKNIPLGLLPTELSISGLSVRQGASPSIEGEVRFSEIAATDVPAEDLLKLLPRWNADAIPDVAGRVSAVGQLAVPLQTAVQPATWSATATVDAEAIVLHDQTIPAASGNIQLVDGQLALSDGTIRCGDEGELSAAARWQLDGSRPSQLLVKARQIPLEMILGLLRLSSHGPHIAQLESAESIEGACDFDGSLQIAANRPFDARHLRGKLTLSSQRLAWNDIVLNDCSLISQLADSKLMLESVSARTASGGRIVAEGAIPLDQQELAQLEIANAQIPIADLLQIGKQVHRDVARTVDSWSS